MAKNDMEELIAALEAATNTSSEPLQVVLPAADEADPEAKVAAAAGRTEKVAADLQTLVVSALPVAATAASSNATATLDGSGDVGRFTTDLLRGFTGQQTVVGTAGVVESLIAGKTSSGAGSSAGSVLSNVFKNMFGISPIISGVLSLFGVGNHDDTPPPLPEFSLPTSIREDAAVAADNSFAPVTYGENGLAKATPGPAPAAATQVNVQVNAMDSRSFMDRSDDIARAVKEAMLHSHSLNDVVVDL
jgi:hypothetical protein